MPEASRIIGNYPNRGPYEAVQSRYVALDDVGGLVMDGMGFRVVDVRTEADSTRTVLFQSSWSRGRSAAPPEHRVA